MYIQEIIIDGFKSYAQKTVVSGFDPQFNAITGLNGTGKSNILDSICFVLGISNLSQVRVGNLQELVYKQGQAGVTKASVTIIFNNTDVNSSPVGYESHKQITVTRQVVIGGKNKYMINGHTVQQNQVQNMFHSVQLNVNNPHFLIMQGRITKVLNMKPPEILSMIEEAAGTRMFETKKQAAIKTIEKKQLKVDEITKCIEEEITPTLENLRTERQDYHAWQANNTEFERLERFCTAYEYQDAQRKSEDSEAEKARMKKNLEDLDIGQQESNAKANDCDSKIAEIEQLRGGEMENELHELRSIETELSKNVVKLDAHIKNQKESLEAEADGLKSMKSQVESAEAQIAEKTKSLHNCEAEIEVKEEECKAAETESANMRERYQNACAGVTDENNSELLSLPEQVGAWEKREREAQSQVQQCQQRCTHARKQLKELQKLSKQQSNNQSSSLNELEKVKNEIVQLESQLQKEVLKQQQSVGSNADNFDESSLRNLYSEMEVSAIQLRDRIDALTASLEARLAFEFRDPEKGFDRSRVKGLVARLVTVKDRKAATALEIAAGGKLYQVVVDTEQTGKLLLQKGGLRKRITILPLNKINARCTDPSKVKKAQTVAKSMGGTAQLALELVGYDAEIQKAMEYVFGSAIICDSPAVAKAIAFDKQIRNRTVTLDGDVYDPAGTLTGGSNNQIGVLLSKIDELASANRELNSKEVKMRELSSKLTMLEKSFAATKDIRTSIELKQHAVRICEEKMADSDYSQTMKEIAEIESEMTQMEAEISTAKDLQKRAKEELTKLKSAQLDSKKRREDAMKDMEKNVKASQKHASNVRAELLKLKGRRDALSTELKACTSELKAIGEQRAISEAAVTRLTTEIESESQQLETLRNEYELAKTATAAKAAELSQCSAEIKQLTKQKEKYLKDVQNASLEARKLKHKLDQWEKDSKQNSKLIATLLKQNPWIESEQKFFGQAGSDFDFGAKDIRECLARRKELKSEQERLSKKINKKVMGMIESAESEYVDLNRKRDVILNDKSKIEAVIEELDVKKAQALQSTWLKVNKDFGSIFSMLLPGTTAKLEPPENCSVMEGLEVKVAFNNVWKDSLTELSGGQRSLLALSLILSLLLFKPAPMYILDEVDAALDLSHTQNIGMMLRTHFSSSQFIVVSLKEGMFNNANVIFRTRFVDGISAVQRTVAGSRLKNSAATIAAATNSILNSQQGADKEEEKLAPKRKKGKVSKALDNAAAAAPAVEI